MFGIDWGGISHSLQNNPLANAASYAWNSSGIGSTINFIKGNRNEKSLLGDIGHEFLGGKEQQKADAAQGQIDSTLSTMLNGTNPYSKQVNPYSTGSTGYQSQLSLLRNSVGRNFTDAEAAAREQFARSGMAGTAQEASALRHLMTDRAKAESGAEAGLAADYANRSTNWTNSNLDKQTAWDQDRQNSFLSLLAGQQGYYQQRADAPKSALAQLVGTGAKAAAAYYTGGKGAF